MAAMTRRQALRSAAALGATLAWPSLLAAGTAGGAGGGKAADSGAGGGSGEGGAGGKVGAGGMGGGERQVRWSERRDLFPQGVASGDPAADSVLLWTRRPPAAAPGAPAAARLTVEIAGDAQFAAIVARAQADLGADNDWTCRVLAAGLQPARAYWYRFYDEHGCGSRVGRTQTAPLDSDSRPVRFAYVSCQNVNQGACNAYRRMIWEDERAAEAERLGFVLHLGDFVYEIVWYPEDRPQGMYDRRLRDVVRYPGGEKIEDFHVPVTVDDYRTLYRGYLTDPDLMDARARWPFVYQLDNHEFSWKGWQGQQNFGGVRRPAQTRKVAANQAWFEYQPARVRRADTRRPDSFTPPPVADRPLSDFDDHGLGLEPDNLAAVGSLTTYRALRWGRNVELILTDNRTYRAEPLYDRTEIKAFDTSAFPWFVSQDVVEALDAGREQAAAPGRPAGTLRFAGREVANPRRALPPQSMLGAVQKAWFLERLRSSPAPWKLWGNTVGMLDWRTDMHNLPPGDGPRWPDDSYALLQTDDWSLFRHERGQILDFVKQHRITGFVTLAGDRHAFTAGRLSKSLPPHAFEPVGAEFITGSISAPGLVEAAEHRIGRDQPLRALYLQQPAGAARPQPAIHVSLMHGVRASLALAATGDHGKALAASNPDVAPHLAFTDLSGHGYGVVRAAPDALDVEFVCIPRPLERSPGADGGPLAYRITHRVPAWEAGAAPRVQRLAVQGDLPLIL